MKINTNKLLLAMAKCGINFSQLSERSNVSRATLSYIKNGKTCRPDVTNKIATALGVDVTEIIDLEEPLRQLPKETPDSIDEQ